MFFDFASFVGFVNLLFDYMIDLNELRYGLN